jgi:hypothetical protein
MADEQKAVPGSDADIEGIVADLLKKGASQEDINKVVQVYDDEKHPFKAAVAGAAGAVPGAVWGTITAPWHLAKATFEDAINVAQGNNPANAQAMIEQLGGLKKKWEEAGPRERGEMVANLVVPTLTGVAAGKFGPGSLKAAAGPTGKALTAVGEHPFASRVGGASAIATGLYTMNPEMIASGAGAMAAPEVATFLGRKLRTFAGESPAAIRLGPKGVEKMNDRFNNAVAAKNIRLNERDAKLAEKASVEARKQAEIESMREGMEPGKPSFSESMSATTPEGGRVSMSRGFKAPEQAMEAELATRGGGGMSPADRARLKKQGYTDDMINRIATQDPGAPKPGGGGGVVAPKPAAAAAPAPAAAVSATPKADAWQAVLDKFYAENPMGAEGRTSATLGNTATSSGVPIKGGLSSVATMPSGRPGMSSDAAMADLEEAYGHGPQPSIRTMGGVAAERPGELPPPGLTVGEMPGPTGAPMSKELMKRQKAKRVPVSEIPASRTSREMSATPGLSKADALALGIDPRMIIKDLDPELVKQMLAERARRPALYREEAFLNRTPE